MNGLHAKVKTSTTSLRTTLLFVQMTPQGTTSWFDCQCSIFFIESAFQELGVINFHLESPTRHKECGVSQVGDIWRIWTR